MREVPQRLASPSEETPKKKGEKKKKKKNQIRGENWQLEWIFYFYVLYPA